MKTRNAPRAGFTLIEMLTVMAVIAILASLIVAVNAFAHKKAALTRAEGEIRAMMAACESYKAEAGSYPRDKDGDTSKLDPRANGDPTSKEYQKASLTLYKSLSGDEEANGKPKERTYCEFRPDQLQKNSSGEIKFLKDPFGNSYGYSTAAAEIEEEFREELQKNPAATRPSDLKGFSPTFDLWSTGGVISKSAASSPAALNAERKRWVKNW